MNSDPIDLISKALHRLRALKDNLPELVYVNEGWVTEYHSVIDSIGDVLDLTEFRIPDEHLVHLDQNPSGANILARYRGVEYVPNLTVERYVGRKTFCMRLDAALAYLDEVRHSGGS
jgi:hypothetical protein